MEINKISKLYVSQNKVLTKAIDNISYKFPQKGMVFVLGKSGCGKTTLLNILGGIDVPTEGSYTYFGNQLSGNQKALDNFRSSEVSFVFQNYNLINELTVLDNLKIANGISNDDELNTQILLVLEKVKLNEDILKKFPTELSGGQQQRVALMRAFLKPHNMILADEPTGNLDSATSKEIFELLKKESENKLVIIVTHEKDSAQMYADEILLIEDGKLQNERDSNIKAEKTVSLNKKNKMNPSMFIKIVGINFKKKFFMILLALTLCVIAVSSICFSRAVGNFNITENTLLTFKENQISSCSVDLINKNANIDLLYNSYKTKTANYFKRVKYHTIAINHTLSNLFMEKHNENSVSFSTENGYVIVENKADIESLFGKQDNNYNDLDGVYLTDIYAKLLIGSYYSTDMTNDKKIESENDLINNYIRVSSDKKYYVKVLGFIKTDFMFYFDNYKNLQTKELEQFKYNLYYKYFNYYGGIDYLNANLTAKTALYNSDGDNIEIDSSNTKIKIDSLHPNASKGEFILAGDKIVDELALQNNEIIINLSLYNQLYGTNYLSKDLVDLNSMLIKKQLDLTKKLNVKFGDKNISEEILNAKIVGVIMEPFDIEKDTSIYINSSLYQSVNFYDNKTNSILIENINLSELAEIMKISGYQINAPYVNELRNYEQQATELYKSYLYISIILTVFFIILMYYIINNIVISNKKNVGILRSLGISKRQCLSIFIVFALILSVLVIAAVSIIVPIWIYFANIQMALTVLQGAVLLKYDTLLVLSLFCLPVCSAILSCFIPLLKLNKMKPIDIINRG